MQEIITYIILIITAGITIYKFVKFFIDSRKGKSPCGNCSKSCDACNLKQYKSIATKKLQV